MGNLKMLLDIRSENEAWRRREKEQEDWKITEMELEEMCKADANVVCEVDIEYPIELKGIMVDASRIVQFAKDNQLMVVNKTRRKITLSWKVTLKNRIKNIFYRLKIK